MSDENYKELLEILGEEYQLYTQLKEFADEKKEALIDNNIDELKNIIKKEESIVRKVRELEEKRNNNILKICAIHELEVENISFQEMIKYIPDPRQEELKDIRNKLLLIIEQVQEQNEQNKMLVTEAINLNNVSITMFLQALEPQNTTYDPKQKADKSKTSHLLDRKG